MGEAGGEAAEHEAERRIAAQGPGNVSLFDSFDEQGERRTCIGRATGVVDELGCHVALDDRVAPLIEPDGLGQKLSTKPVGDAADRVDSEPHRSAPKPRAERRREHRRTRAPVARPAAGVVA